MTEQNDEHIWRDRLLWLVVAFIICGGIFGSSYVAHYQLAFQIVGWLLLLSFAAGIGYLTHQGKNFVALAKESKNELRKVVWPSRDETVKTAMIVMVIVFITGFILWGIDTLFLWLVGLLAGHGVFHG